MKISFAANHGEIGGGEVMLLAMARAARELGHDVEVVAPSGKLLENSSAQGFRTVTIHGGSTLDYLRGLRRWAKASGPALLWCNGLRPAVATSFLPHRVVHLHSLPAGPLRALSAVAIQGARRVIVPSAWMNAQLGAKHTVLPNWTDDLPFIQRTADPTGHHPVRLGFLGRLTADKGALVLAAAVEQPNAREPGRYRVIVGGSSRFATDDDAAKSHSALAELRPETEFLGWVDREDFFRQIDLAVFPSVFPESFGLVAAEAMAVGCPYVMSDAGALSEVTQQDPRFVAAAGAVTSLAEAISAAAASYPAERITQDHSRWLRLYSPAAGRRRLAELLASLEEH